MNVSARKFAVFLAGRQEKMRDRWEAGRKKEDTGSLMMKQLWKCGMLSRLFGCLFIQNFCDRSLTRGKVRIMSAYTFYSAVWILFSTSLSAVFIFKVFLSSEIAHSFTKSLIFILNNVVTVKIVLNFTCMTLGSSRLLRFLRDSEAYEKSASFENADSRSVRIRKVASLAVLVVVYGLGMTIYAGSTTQQDSSMRVPVLVCSSFTLFVFLFYDSLAYVVLSSCSAVLAEYLRAELATLRSCRTPWHVEQVRLRFSLIKKLKLSLNQVWHPALAVWAACLILVLCVSLYAIFDGDIGQPEVWLALAYSAYASMSFADVAISSQCLSDLAQQLKDASLLVEMSGESYNEQVQFLHRTVDPEALCFTGGGFFHLNKALLVSMSGSIITYAVILVQTSEELAEHVDVSRLV
ncbi:hypothetical protein MRX96_033545 [Rhipicephalus microplus]|nr:uncharacterized protein LOC119163925 [Rhipicephalus microplus]